MNSMRLSANTDRARCQPITYNHCGTKRARFSSKRLVDRFALSGKKPCALLSDMKTVFQTNSKLTIDRDRWFVAEAHARLNRRLVAAYKVGPFVSVQSDAVPCAMRQAGHFVIGTKAGGGDHFACG